MTFTKLSKKQKTVFRWAYKPDAYALICDGSVRSGKTASMACAFILWAMATFDRARFGICGNTVQSAERNIIMELLQMADITHYFNVSYIGGSKHILTVKGNGKQNQFHVFGGKDEASYKLVQGITLSGVLFDEVALMPESFVNQAIARTLSVGDARLWFNCNPDNPQHWFYQQWILKADNGERNDVLHLHFTMQDNPIMTPQKIQRAASVYPAGAFYDRYVLGLWRVAEGLVYPDFDPAVSVVHNYKPSERAVFYLSIDYGTLNPTSIGLWAVEDDFAVRSDILPRLKRRGLPLARTSSRFSFEQSTDYSISELTPCVPRFYWLWLCENDSHSFISDIDCSVYVSVVMCATFRAIPCSYAEILCFCVFVSTA